MSIERIYHCDGPDCQAHVKTVGVHPPAGFLAVREDADHQHHFCTWDCLLMFAGRKPPAVTIPSGEETA